MKCNDYYNKYLERGEYDADIEDCIKKASKKPTDEQNYYCHYCQAVYIERPRICICMSNVFLKDIRNEKS